jgi:hypothetical protein
MSLSQDLEFRSAVDAPKGEKFRERMLSDKISPVST